MFREANVGGIVFYKHRLNFFSFYTIQLLVMARESTYVTMVTGNRLLDITLVLVVLIFLFMRQDTSNAYAPRQVGPGASNVSKSNKYKFILQKHGIPEDYFERDLIKDNHLVDALSPLLTTNSEVIEEAQRIQMVMFKALIGKFKFAMLLCFAAFENKGDPAISVGELNIIKKLGIQIIFHCETGHCHENVILDKARNISGKFNTEDIVILMQGGGNMLSYLHEDYARKLVLETFPNHEVVLFPQSIWHVANQEETRKYQNAYSKHKHLTILYRDRPSYNLGRKLFPDVKCFLMPDMAFQIGTVERFLSPTHDIMWVKRTDIESPKYNIPSIMYGYDVIAEDWLEWWTPRGRSKLENSVLMAANGMMFLQRGRVVVTDRLHGHILSVLCGIQHVIIDPVNKKTSSYMRSWTGGIENILIANSSDDALNKAIELLRKLDDMIPKKLL